MGGREDFAALFHEAGHTEHYAHVDASLPVEDRYLGDNSVTEGFAFLFEHLTSDPEWLRRRLGIEDPEPIVATSARRGWCSCAATRPSSSYELELHGGGSIEGLDAVYARRLSDAVHVDWPAVSWLSDVDPFFYVARYLRAWALETHLRSALRERFGEAWFDEPEAGAFLRELWSAGQGAAGGEGILERVGGSAAGLRRGARRGRGLVAEYGGHRTACAAEGPPVAMQLVVAIRAHREGVDRERDVLRIGAARQLAVLDRRRRLALQSAQPAAHHPPHGIVHLARLGVELHGRCGEEAATWKGRIAEVRDPRVADRLEALATLRTRRGRVVDRLAKHACGLV